jgi:hypothetical protein
MGRISFQKRQKEMKRQEKQQMKAERRAQRKLAKTTGPEVATDEFGMPLDAETSEQELAPAAESDLNLASHSQEGPVS